MKKALLFSGLAVMAFVCFVSGVSTGSPCFNDNHGLRGTCKKVIIDGSYYYVCNRPASLQEINCSIYVE